MKRLRQLLKTTAVRLTLVYTVLFGLLAVGVVAYVSVNTGRLIISQIQSTIDEEVNEIARQSRNVGIRQLIPMVERRSRRPGANLYLISDASGRIIAGNVRDLNRSLLTEDGWRIPPFDYQRFTDSDERSFAIARVFSLPGGLKLLIGRDVRDAERFRQTVLRATTFSLGVMVFAGLAVWFFVGRRALRHIDSVSKSSRRIIDGDLSQRLPVSGSGDEFDRLSTSLNGIISRVEKLNSGVVTMSDSIAHDLKTPLAKIRNSAEAALSENPASEDLQAIIDDADRLIKTFNALLMISQVESGVRAVDFEKLNLRTIVEDVFELYEPSAQEADVLLEQHNLVDADINCNRELIAQIITNVLDNAFKYGSDGHNPKFVLEMMKSDEVVSLLIKDNGAGIPERDHEAVMERFVRLDTSRSKPGSGLGLSLVKAIVRLHDGSLKLRDNNPGLIVEISLPLVQ